MKKIAKKPAAKKMMPPKKKGKKFNPANFKKGVSSHFGLNGK